jgi:hypothetical protein
VTIRRGATPPSTRATSVATCCRRRASDGGRAPISRLAPRRPQRLAQRRHRAQRPRDALLEAVVNADAVGRRAELFRHDKNGGGGVVLDPCEGPLPQRIIRREDPRSDRSRRCAGASRATRPRRGTMRFETAPDIQRAGGTLPNGSRPPPELRCHVKAPAQPTGDTPFKASPPFVDNSNFKALPVRYAPTWHFPSANTRATRAHARAHGAEPAGPSGRSDYFIMRCQWPRLAAGTGAGPDPALAQSGNAKRMEGHPSRKCV